MNTTSSILKSSLNYEDIKYKIKDQLKKSLSMISNNNLIYEKYIRKPIKNKSRNDNNSLIQSNSLSKYKNKSNQNSFGLLNIDNEDRKVNINNSMFNIIMDNYFKERKNDIKKRKNIISMKKNFSKNKPINIEINLNNSSLNNRKSYSNYHIKNEKINKINKQKIEVNNNKNQLKFTRKRNLSIKDIDNISNMINLKIPNNNYSKQKEYKSNNSKSKRKNTYLTSPTTKIIYKSKLIHKSKSLIKINDINNTNNNYLSINKTSRNSLYYTNNNYNLFKSNENELTKPNTINSKNEKEKKEYQLEGPELIHFSLIKLIQKEKKKMEEISKNIELNNRK